MLVSVILSCVLSLYQQLLSALQTIFDAMSVENVFLSCGFVTATTTVATELTKQLVCINCVLHRACLSKDQAIDLCKIIRLTPTVAKRQSARMSKITNDHLTQSGTGCFIAVPYGNSGC